MKKLGKVLLEALVQASTSANAVPSMDTVLDVLDQDLQGKPRIMASRMVARVYFLQDEAKVLIKAGMHLTERKSTLKGRSFIWTPLSTVEANRGGVRSAQEHEYQGRTETQ